VTVQAPELRIIDDATWTAAQKRKEKSAVGHPIHVHRRPKRLLSGLVRCGCCNSLYIVADGIYILLLADRGGPIADCTLIDSHRVLEAEHFRSR
jgi:hypothetical protein